MKKRKTIGLALGSGAYRGFAHIGVLRVFEKHGIPIDYLSGASVGAWIGAYYSLFRDTQKLEADLTNNNRENMALLLDFNWGGGVIGGNKFARYLERKLEGRSFSETQIPLRIVATDLCTARPYVFSRGDIAAAVRASASIPVLFKPIMNGSCILADGGMSDPVPCDQVRELGADIVIGVNLYHKNELKDPKLNLSQLVVRSSLVMLHNLAKTSVAPAQVVITPDLSDYLLKSNMQKYFTPALAQEMIAAGTRAAEKALPSILKLIS